jgi:hypothetical protein
MQCSDRKTCGQGSGLTAVFVRLATGNPADGRIFSGWCAPDRAFVPSGLTGFQGFADHVKKDLRTCTERRRHQRQARQQRDLFRRGDCLPIPN